MADFVVQKHKATNLHYDLRIEISNTLKSWAIPKGPSIDNTVKRLAIPVPDHDLAYIDFEGVIPQGQYGAGAVIVWDRGKIKSANSEALENQFAKGRLEICFSGKKLQGKFVLIKTGQNWLFFKAKDKFAKNEDILKMNKSVISGKKVEQIG